MIKFPSSGNVFQIGLEHLLDGSASYDPDGDELGYLWKSDKDGEIGSSPKVSVSLSSGTHEICLTVSDPSLNHTICLSGIRVNVAPIAKISSPIDTQTFIVGEAINLNGGLSHDPDGNSLVKYIWELEIDGKKSSLTGKNIYITAVLGRLEITLIVVDDSAGAGVATLWVEVEYPKLPGLNSAPRDLDNDGKPEDLNGNGRLDFADMLALFRTSDQEFLGRYNSIFDYSGDGRVDFEDVQFLFDLWWEQISR